MKKNVPLLMKKNPSVKDAILIWLICRQYAVVKSSYLETDFKQFLRKRYGRIASASTIARRWRELKGAEGPLEVTEVGRSPEGEWIPMYFGTENWHEWTIKQRSLAHG